MTTRVTIANRIAATDQRLLSRMTAADMPALDRAMTGLGRAADHGGLWFAVATALGARRSKWTRRAALRGLAGIAIASPTVNVLAKRLVGRTRLERPLFPVGRLARPLRTTSFPSGHAASAGWRSRSGCWSPRRS